MAGEPWRQFDCYKVLYISPGATPDEIRIAYRKVSLRTHPDSGGSHEAQVRVNLAYEVLSDPVSRQAHDFFWYKSATQASRAEKPAGAGAGSTGPFTPHSKPRRTESSAEETRSTSTGLGSSLERLFKRVEERIDYEVEQLRTKRSENIKTKFTQYCNEFENSKKSRRWRFAASVILTLIALSMNTKFAGLIWVGAICAWLYFGAGAFGTRISSEYLKFDDSSWQEKVQSIASKNVDDQIELQQAGLQGYKGKIASLGEIVSRPSSFDVSEEQVARRITISLFIMGYVPERHDRQSRILIFASGEERILVRFRHRSGIATNITYVERMVEAMRAYRCTRGILFCTPGLSGNGEVFAKSKGITWYSLKTMNEWVDNVLDGRYAGPSGDILGLLDNLLIFLGQIATPLSYRGRWTRRH